MVTLLSGSCMCFQAVGTSPSFLKQSVLVYDLLKGPNGSLIRKYET